MLLIMYKLYFVSVSMASLWSTKSVRYMHYTMQYGIYLCLLCVGKPTPEGPGGEARESKEGEGKESG